MRNIKKSVAENYFLFPQEMYTSLAGSIVVTSYILSEEKPDLKEIQKKWKYFTRHGFEFSFADEKYVEKVCEAFGVELFPLDCAAYVQSEYNCLIAPYVEIDYCPVNHVKKPNGAKAGMVIYEGYRTALVKPDGELADKLRKS